MDINYVIAFLQKAKDQGATRVVFDRDFIPVAEIELETITAIVQRALSIVVVKEVPDEFSPVRWTGGRISMEEASRRKRVDDAFAHKIKEASMFQIPNKTQLQEYLEDVRNRL